LLLHPPSGKLGLREEDILNQKAGGRKWRRAAIAVKMLNAECSILNCGELLPAPSDSRQARMTPFARPTTGQRPTTTARDNS
jgi:hypothetical protein